MAKWICTFVLLGSSLAFANMKFSFKNEDLDKVIDTYSRATGQKFVVDPGVRGKATITAADDVSAEEAFNLLSNALAVNGFAISTQGDTMVVLSARNIQRNLIETTSTLPALKPERMTTYVMTLKNVPVDMINRELRILPSKDGEMSVLSATNQLIISDWASNIHRVHDILQKLDVPADPKVAKVIEAAKKEREKRAQTGKKLSETK